MALTKGAVETDKIRSLVVNWMPIYISFLDTLEAEDEKTATQIEDILELEHFTDNKDTQPEYSGIKISTLHNVAPSSIHYTEVFGDWGLTTDLKYESVAFDLGAFYDTLQFKTNAGMLKKVIGPMRKVILRQDHPYFHFSSNFTYPSIKRANPYTFCGVLFHLPQMGQFMQVGEVADTTAIDHVNIEGRIRYDEWNSVFDQSPQ